MNTKISVSIVDDEQHGRDFIALLLANEFPQLEIAFKAKGVEDAKMLLQKTQPDILFLDIQLGDGTSFELLAALRDIASQVIFITAYDHYALQAIKNDAVDYVLKPVRKDDFITAVNKALRNIMKNKQQDSGHSINLPTLHGFKKVAVTEIIRCEADSNYTLIYLNNKTKVMVSRTLQEFEKQLSELNFFRIHHKHLINLSHFTEYIKGKGGKAVLSDGSVIDVSVRRKNDFLERLKSL